MWALVVNVQHRVHRSWASAPVKQEANIVTEWIRTGLDVGYESLEALRSVTSGDC